MNDNPSIMIILDRETLKPIEVFYNGETDEETVKLQKIVDRMIESVKKEKSENVD